MVSIKSHFLLLKAILLTKNKKFKYVIALVNTRESLQKYHKDLSWGPSFSIFLLMIYFLLLTSQPYVTTLMIMHFTLRVMMQMLSLVSWSRTFRKYLNGSMIFNPDKSSFLTLGFQDPQSNFSYGNITIKNISEEKILGITIDNKLTFKNHSNEIRITLSKENFAEFLHKISIFLLLSNLDVYI